MTDELNRLLADCDASELLKQIRRFDLQLRIHMPDAVLFTDTGELNLRNKYGAILSHCRQLSSVLHNFDIGE